jgi:hypothetical protein
VIAALSAWAASGAHAQQTRVTFDEVSKRVAERNHLVLEGALKVYQAKEAVQVARANLLPKLNVWKIVGAVVDPMDSVGLIEDVAPFLVPANWFRKGEQRILLEAQKEGYRSLWANELMTSRTLYLQILFDQAIRDQVSDQISSLQSLHQLVRTRETWGKAKPGTAREIEIRMLGLEEDIRRLDVLLAEERGQLGYLLGVGARQEVALEPVTAPEDARWEPMKYEDHEARVVQASAELRQFKRLVEVASKVKKEIYYSFLGASSQSRGVAGGVFDGLPVQSGLGFGLGASIRITKAQKQILELQAKGVEETLKRQLKLLVTSHNLDLLAYKNQKRRYELTRDAEAQLLDRIRMGAAVEVDATIEASRNHLQAQAALTGAGIRHLIQREKLKRLKVEEIYAQEPRELAELEERGDD